MSWRGDFDLGDEACERRPGELSGAVDAVDIFK
jgi:hypothetical protein